MIPNRYYCIVAAVAIAVNLNTLNGDFVYDDRHTPLESNLIFQSRRVMRFRHIDAFAADSNFLRSSPLYSLVLSPKIVYSAFQAIVANADVSGIGSMWRIFANDFWGIPLSHPGSHRSYRPLIVLTFRFNYALFGFSPLSYHMSNAVCHAIASLLFIALVDRIFQLSQMFILFCGLLFAVHAVHAEAVASIVGRADVVATICVLSTFYVYLQNKAQTSKIRRSDEMPDAITVDGKLLCCLPLGHVPF
ncbi:unnamed protein product [Toxocara canis]|uniref:Transmembrane and TPR repeat-containing protein CG4341 n=1 Tax=Toxocara canis TaxID=6265 RepID=A0A183V374_TOXCA|nr:unnamed protein product [Toxocara canis]